MICEQRHRPPTCHQLAKVSCQSEPPTIHVANSSIVNSVLPDLRLHSQTKATRHPSCIRALISR